MFVLLICIILYFYYLKNCSLFEDNNNQKQYDVIFFDRNFIHRPAALLNNNLKLLNTIRVNSDKKTYKLLK